MIWDLLVSFQWSVTAALSWCGSWPQIKTGRSWDWIMSNIALWWFMVLNERAPAFTTSNLSVSSQRSTKGFPTALGRRALPLVSCFLFQDFSMAEELGVHQWFKTLNAWSRLYTEPIHSLLFKDFTEQGRERDFRGYFMSCIYQSQLVF